MQSRDYDMGYRDGVMGYYINPYTDERSQSYTDYEAGWTDGNEERPVE